MIRIVLAVCMAMSLAAPAFASADPRAIAVLNAEARWTHAIDAGDATTIAQILAPNFVHINYRGVLQYREATLAAAKQRKPYAQNVRAETA